MGNDVPDWSTQSRVNLVNAQSTALGDPATQLPAPDTATDAPVGVSPLSLAGGVMASFKPAAGSTVAKVGSFGALATGVTATVSPAFGQATVAGHLLAAWVTASSAEPTTAAAGWAKVLDLNVGGAWVALWARPNCGAAEAAPTFTCASGHITAQLSEWSGVATATPTDQTAAGSTSAGQLSLANLAADAGYGDLILMATLWPVAKLSNPTFTQSFGNQAAGGQAGVGNDNGFLTSALASSFSFAIVPAAPAELPLGVRAWDYDSFLTHAPAAGTLATVTFPATAGKAWRLAFLDASLEQTAATATGVDVQVLDGVTVIFSRILGVPAAIGQSAGFNFTGASIKGTAGNLMTVKFSAGVAGANMRVNAGAYLQ